jgi:hypothetical protein
MVTAKVLLAPLYLNYPTFDYLSTTKSNLYEELILSMAAQSLAAGVTDHLEQEWIQRSRS